MTTQHPGQWETRTQPDTPRGYLPGVVRNGMGVAALVLGILGLLTSLIAVGGILGLLAIVFGAIGRARANRGEATNGGVALTGLVLGVVATLVSAGLLVFASMNTEELNDFNSCMEQAATQAQEDACAQQFGNEISN